MESTPYRWSNIFTLDYPTECARLFPMKKTRTILDKKIIPASKPLPLCHKGQRIFRDVLEAMQNAEELGGPEGDNYVALMKCIAAEAIERISNFRSHTPKSS